MAEINKKIKPGQKEESGISEQEARDRERELRNALDFYHKIQSDVADATLKLTHAMESLGKFEKVECKKSLLQSVFLHRRLGAGEFSKSVQSLRGQLIRACDMTERMEKRSKRDLEEEILNPSLHR